MKRLFACLVTLFWIGMHSSSAQADATYNAAGAGDLAAVQRLVRANPQSVNSRIPQGQGEVWEAGATPLHAAARNGRLEIVRYLISMGADVNARRKDGDTALLESAYQGHLAVSNLLIESGANVNLPGVGASPLHWAAERGHLDVVRLLLDRGADIAARDDEENRTPLMRAVAAGQMETSRLLIKRGAALNARTRHGSEAIHLAAQMGQTQTLALLLYSGVDIDTPNADGDSPLAFAGWYGQTGPESILVACGANLNSRNKDGRTPRDLALMNGKPDFVTLLDRYQAMLNDRAARDALRKEAGQKIRTSYANWTVSNAQTHIVYHNDFVSDQIGAEWSTYPMPGTQQAPLHVSITPKGSRHFLG